MYARGIQDVIVLVKYRLIYVFNIAFRFNLNVSDSDDNINNAVSK